MEEEAKRKDERRRKENARKRHDEAERLKGEAARVAAQESAIQRRPGGRELMDQLRQRGYASKASADDDTSVRV